MKPSRQPVISASPLPQEARAAAEASLEAALNAGADVHTRYGNDLAVNEQAKRLHPRCKRIVAAHWTDGYVVNGPLSS